ncbi:MAG TPA: uracil-DNA glycosylase family protein [Actinomycetes bacterium]|jgi:DNA polymerase|nr:uracil-DNA glycosylase family protein [Actinomycetes bacterium]
MPTELELVAAEAATCTRCRLHQGRTQVVFGDGDPHADLMFVGEAPGFHEDKQGKPFVGPSGQLLNRLLAGIGLRREDVYTCNVVKSRPPGNRDPQPDEIAACRGWLDAQVRLVDPKVVVTLGNFAAKTLLETTTGITRLRGRTYPFQGRVLLPTFHPAAALHATSSRVGPSPLQGMEEDFEVLAKLLAESQSAPTAPTPSGVPASAGPMTPSASRVPGLAAQADQGGRAVPGPAPEAGSSEAASPDPSDAKQLGLF